ncbi:efflux RND transporter permease subunit [Psychroserpens sp.]|uniref:efflux RND transporter permease subunit n=1 Tax=Psychroserpens sp. TaxID=2020870 RepID=UPI001B1CF250|nr:efflux RND transporter permease subunit [Psychroserpens sp.]MBO6607944.1 efflux RND transporter permease subunit [Psychroserpens sp.]MBO6630628.1 efflux RND transporter permease subunit [Psychroserpens sp.]MBO6654929.1 efflux RND transporter permease subunit [Psychroserpens sp.]MBO6682997.1 efflux RND transporter permease subunit [Psychroserpens sp.]MBO6751302.1 efflux RND transporter permease subunit [Psychroserpens sp.]
MNLAAFSINRNRITFTVLTTIVIMGLVMYQSLSRDSMPPYTVRVASVVSSFPGSSPERVEQLVTDKVEKVVQELPELKKVTSTSRSGLSVVSVELKDEVKPKDLQSVWDRLRRKLNQIEGLPSGVQPNLNDDGIGEVFGIAVGLVIDGFSYAEAKSYVNDIKDDFIKLDLAAKVELGGVQDERVFIEFDNARLKEYGLSASKLQSIISSTNILSSGGEVNLGDERIILEPTGNFNSIDDIKQTLIPVGDGSQLVYLGDITTVRQSYIDPPKQLVTVNGQRAISMHISLKAGANIIQLGEDLNLVMKDWEARLPVGLELQRLSSLDTYIDNKISDFIVNLLQSIAIVLLVMLIFLGVRTGSIIASLIPMVTIMTLMLMGVIDMGLNQVTLAALIMALGMMVDNAIVVAETIMVKMEKGIDAKKAAIDACSELFTPLLISTLTTSAAFLAFYLAESTMGDIVGPIFVVISLALLSSWILALTVITLFCFLFLKITPKSERKESLIDKTINNLKRYYKNLILIALSYKRLVLIGIVGAFILSLLGFGQIAFVFFPDSDRNMITLDVNLPQGTRLEATETVISEIEQFIRTELQVNSERPNGISDWSAYIGSGPESYDLGYNPDEPDPSYAHMLINTSDFIYNNEMVERLDDYCFNNFPNADIKVGLLGSGGGGTPIEIKISGEDPDVLAILSEQTKQKLNSVTGTKNVKDDWGPKTKKFVVKIDQNKAQLAGVTSSDIATSLQTVLDGFQTGEYREDDKSIPILMRSNDSQQQTLASIETLSIFAQNSGKSVPLLQVASIEPQWQYAKIKRLDIDRTINVSSELNANGNASAIMKEMNPYMAEVSQEWPDGYTYTFGGDAENTAENMGAVISYLPLSGFIIILLLIIQFNSVRKTVMVASTIPLGIIGVVIGLLIFQEPFGFMPFLGVISLAGIVINNAIVLIDRIQIEETELQRPIEDAIIAACLQRFRPILLATFTTVLGLIPLYLSGGEMWEGMAVSIMIGLLFGTVITLLFIPAFYSILFKVNYKNYEFNESILDD